MRIGFFVQLNDPESAVHIELAELMMRSARLVMPDVPIVQLTDDYTPRVIGVDDCIRLPGDMPMAVRRMTLQAMDGDWLFVDPDVMFRRDVRDVFDIDFDVAITDRAEITPERESDYSRLMPHNTGVVFSKSKRFWERVRERLLKMEHKYQEWTGDQMVICGMAKDERVIVLPGKVYNFPPEGGDTDVSGAAIVHYKGNRKHMMRLDAHLIIGGVPLPRLKTYAVMGNGERSHFMTLSKAQGFPVLDMQDKREGCLSIACYGPSLKDTWQDLKRPILSISGAHDFLIVKGIVPDYHLDCDPRQYKANFVKQPHKDVHYLMGSCMHPDTWENLKGMNVTLWHAFNGDETDNWMRSHGKGQITLGGGSTAGLRAIMVGGALGYSEFDIHGMDCSYDETPWAGVHYSKAHKKVMRVRCGTRWFKTSGSMVAAAREFEKLIRNIPIKFTLRGDGLLTNMLKTTGYEKLCA